MRTASISRKTKETDIALSICLDGGEIAVGKAGDVTIACLDESEIVDSNKFESKGKNTPFNGYELFGVVKYTIVDGEVKYEA